MSGGAASFGKRLAREWATLAAMVDIFCRGRHGGGESPCAECGAFLEYAEVRLQKCPYGEAKPTCARCPIHCYRPARRTEAKRIMRFAGPRMLLRHPLLALAHQLDGLRKAVHPRELRRQRPRSPKTA